MTTAFQPDAYQNNAYQVDVALIEGFAFQECAFQADAFQADVCGVVSAEVSISQSGGSSKAGKRRNTSRDYARQRANQFLYDTLDAQQITEVAQEVIEEVAEQQVFALNPERTEADSANELIAVLEDQSIKFYAWYVDYLNAYREALIEYQIKEIYRMRQEDDDAIALLLLS